MLVPSQAEFFSKITAESGSVWNINRIFNSYQSIALGRQWVAENHTNENKKKTLHILRKDAQERC